MSEHETEGGYIPERGYWLGPTLQPGEVPWPLFWEQQSNLDDCVSECRCGRPTRDAGLRVRRVLGTV
jgi:hypothetical protein